MEIQSSTNELVVGLLTLVHQTGMGEIPQAAMDALLALHRPDRVHLWNPEAPLNTFWDIRSVQSPVDGLNELSVARDHRVIELIVKY